MHPPAPCSARHAAVFLLAHRSASRRHALPGTPIPALSGASKRGFSDEQALNPDCPWGAPAVLHGAWAAALSGHFCPSSAPIARAMGFSVRTELLLKPIRHGPTPPWTVWDKKAAARWGCGLCARGKRERYALTFSPWPGTLPGPSSDRLRPCCLVVRPQRVNPVVRLRACRRRWGPRHRPRGCRPAFRA